MRAGGLKYQIELYKPERRDSGYSSGTTIWYERARATRADILFHKGAIVKEGREYLPSYSVEFRIRNYHDVQETWRVKYKDKFYNIEAIIPNDKRQLVTLVTNSVNE